jgi:Mrp family chromosome partitioning ATPase
MSTLNRALAKVYGRTAAQSLACAEPTSAPPECLTDDDPDGKSDALEETSDEAAVSIFNVGHSIADIESASVIQLPKTTIRIDGPCSSVVEPPHLVFPDADSVEPKKAPLSEGDSESETTHVLEISVAEQAACDTDCDSEEEAGQSPAVEFQSTTKISVPLAPEWEVDRFRWPETCQKLLLEKDEAFEAAIELLCNMRSGGRMTVALVGETSGDGASTTALCIARHAAQLGQNVLLVDADVSAPKLATLVGLNTPCSWHDSVVGDVPLAESIVVSVEDRLCLMPLHADCEQSSLVLTDERVSALLQQASEANDLVILDCGSIDRLAERVDSNGHLPCDVAVVVRNASREEEVDPTKVTQALQALGVDNILFAENFVREPKPANEKLQHSAA